MSDDRTDPLPSWNDGPVKDAILTFVRAVTTEGGPEYVPPAERVATFDNDGTLWTEHPLQTQVFYANERLAALARKDPTMRERQPFKALFEKDLKTLHELGKRAVFEIAFATHAGMTVDEFVRDARTWLDHAVHPTRGHRFRDCVYQPQLELLRWLRANGFATYIVSGGGQDFIRAIAEDVYGVPPQQVIGSSVKTRFELHDGHAVFVKLAELQSFDDREVKAENIQLHVGRQPILAVGNSDGDLAMMRWALAGPGRRLALLVHHDDAAREVAYDRDFRLSPLAEALDKAEEYGITVASMRRDWGKVFAWEAERAKARATAGTGA